MASPTKIPLPEPDPAQRIPPLQNGDRLTCAEFEHRYDAMPNLTKAELIEGVVYVPPPVSFVHHGGPHADLVTWVGVYRAGTPGVEAGDNTSLRLDLDNEPQPDVFARVAPACGGQSRTDEDGYVAGAPELVAEVAASSVSYDLHAKLHVYRRNAVREYVVWRVLDREVDWFVLREGRYEPLAPVSPGLYQSECLPGLWLDAAALVHGDLATVLNVVQQGLATPEHGAFVERLRQAASKSHP